MKRKRNEPASRPTKKARKTVLYKSPFKRQNAGLKDERKFIDTTATANGLNTTGVVQAINLSAIGDDNNSRDGRQTLNTSIKIRGLISPEDLTTNPSLVRVLLVWDKQPNGALATIANILSNATALSMNNLDNKYRFKILRDYQFPVGGQNNTATQTYVQSPTVWDINDFVKLPPDCVTGWTGTTAAIASVATGSLLLVQIGTQAAGTGCNLECFTRVRWIG